MRFDIISVQFLTFIGDEVTRAGFITFWIEKRNGMTMQVGWHDPIAMMLMGCEL